MNWDATIDRIGKVIDLLIKAEIHAFSLIGIGAALYVHGQHEAGEGVLTAGLAVFRGNR